MLPNAGPGLSETDEDGLDAQGIAEALERGELTCLYLLGRPWRLRSRAVGRWEDGHRPRAFLTDALREQADVVFPAEAYAEKEGTVTHPDGRIQRLRPAIARQGVRAEWPVLASSRARRARPGRADGAMASRRCSTRSRSTPG